MSSEHAGSLIVLITTGELMWVWSWWRRRRWTDGSLTVGLEAVWPVLNRRGGVKGRVGSTVEERWAILSRVGGLRARRSERGLPGGACVEGTTSYQFITAEPWTQHRPALYNISIHCWLLYFLYFLYVVISCFVNNVKLRQDHYVDLPTHWADLWITQRGFLTDHNYINLQ